MVAVDQSVPLNLLCNNCPGTGCFLENLNLLGVNGSRQNRGPSALPALSLTQERLWAASVIAEILAPTLIVELHKEKPKEVRELFRTS